MFVIVRKHRKRAHAREAEKFRNIDDGVELDFTVSADPRMYKEGPAHGQGQEQGKGQFPQPPPEYHPPPPRPGFEDRFGLQPPKY